MILVFGVCFTAVAIGAWLGRRNRHLSDSLSESFGVLQGAMLGVVGLILAFGLSLALSRYEERRDKLVEEANAIEVAFLRGQVLNEPERTQAIDRLRTYVAQAVEFSNEVPDSDAAIVAEEEEDRIQRALWRTAATEVREYPEDTAPRLYIEALNTMIDAQNSRIAALTNQVPDAVLLLEVLGAAIALALLAAYMALVGRGTAAVVLAAFLVGALLYVTADLDRPTRGIINVPDTALVRLENEMARPPASGPPPGEERSKMP
ncbi:hypothetical protein HJD18_11970 [Thermoleophilia bacterium SCSIO 60948]|nr:hypothetical protein HJD18_11970 [Thermoleophilia bacterium SCSIO 60948]